MLTLDVESVRGAIALGLVTCAAPPGAGDVSCRDPGFEANWQRASSPVSDALSKCPLAAHEQALSQSLRLGLFEHVKQSTADVTCAAYVADDFELILGAAMLQLPDPWVRSLWSTYYRGRCPYVRDE